MNLLDTLQQTISGYLGTLGAFGTQDKIVETRPGTRRRKRQPPRQPTTITRWLRSDIEAAQRLADNGDLTKMAQLRAAMLGDGELAGLLSTRTGGLVRLAKLWYGDEDAIAWLRGNEGAIAAFDMIFPTSELEQLATDGLVIGVGVGEFIEPDGDEHPHLVRLNPEFLRYRRYENRWYYQSIDGLEPITPGDGRWVLHRYGGEQDPWKSGLLVALAKPFIDREHAELMRANYAAKLANPARVAVSPAGASEEQTQAWFQKVMAWGVNTVFGMKPGYDVKLLEVTNGRGIDVFKDILAQGSTTYKIAIAGQTVTADGGAGFVNKDIHATIRSDLVEATGSSLARDISTQGVVPLCSERAQRKVKVFVKWDTRPPTDLKAAADSMAATAKAISDLTAALKPFGVRIDIKTILAKFGVPVADAAAQELPAHDPPVLTRGGISASLDRSAGYASSWCTAKRAPGAPVPVLQVYQGVPIFIEYPVGSVRTGTDPAGHQWSTTMSAAYGYVAGTHDGGDGEPVDAFVGPAADCEVVWWVELVKPDGSHDELKLVFGCHTQQQAMDLCLAHIPQEYIGGISPGTVSQIRSLLGLGMAPQGGA